MRDVLHDGELAADAAIVTALLRARAPELAALRVRPIRGVGTVNRVFRLGTELAVRLPRLEAGGEDLLREARVVPLVAAALPVAVPEPVVLGEPVEGVFAARWAVVRWVDGDPAEAGAVPEQDLAAMLLALRGIDVAALPDAGRTPAAEVDAAVRESIGRLDGFDRARVERCWTRLLGAPPWDGVRVPVHADLLPPNLVVRDGGLTGVLDWGAAGAGDPANDLVPAWSCLRGADRPRLRAAVGADDGTWARARGIALAQAVVAIPYYYRSNPRFAALCRATLTEVLDDPDGR